MNDRPGLNELSAFIAIATQRSFRKAADALGLSASTLSHMMRTLEHRMGARLLNRTTRSVSPTAAGEMLLARLQPILRDLDIALAEVDEFSGQPSGILRINASEIAALLLLRSVIPTFLNRYPKMHLDLAAEGKFVDIVSQGFDAGIRLGESVPQDMIAIRFGGPARLIPVASPSYLAMHGTPQTPDDLAGHNCVRFRLPSGKLFHWEFEKNGQEISVDVNGHLTLDRVDLMAEAALLGLVIAFVPERTALPFIETGRLTGLLDSWCPKFPGLVLYYPGHRLVPPGLRAFVDVLRETESQMSIGD